MDDFSSEFFDSNGLNDIGWPLAITGTEIQPSFTANADSYIAPDLPSDLIGGVEPGSLDDLAFDFEGMFDRPPAGQFEPPLFVVSQNAPQPTEPTLDIPAVHAGRSRRAKARGPTALSWSRQKSNIKKLYIDEDKTLEETRKLMETRHGFSATYAHS
ncbi:hypothetical protein RRF57_009699 [Xylaria bambusicola]|uniref:Clr5 domain-containing protein n=1 Tax=Xylaria bambusicola TaxID=326684 RepID=A0AAN7UK24_9PEZI